MPVTYLYPSAVTLDEGWVPNAGSEVTATDDTQGAPDNDTTYIEANTSAAARIIRFSMTPMVDCVSIQRVKLFMVSRDAGGGTYLHTPNIITDGVTTTLTGRTLTSSYATYTSGDSGGTWEWTVSPATSNPWTQAQLNSIQVQVQQALNALGVGRITSLYLEVTYTPISGDIGIVRFLASHALRLFRRPIPGFRNPVPLTALDWEMGDDFSVVHFAGPHPQGLGWRLVPPTERELHRLTQASLDLNTMQLEVLGDDRREFLCTFWETFEATRTSLAEDGNAQLKAGGATTMARASDMWDVDPGSYLVSRYGAGIKALVDHGSEASPTRGMVIEQTAINQIRRSSFITGSPPTGWSRTGGGAGAALASETPTDPLFASDVTSQCLKLTMGDDSADHVLSSPETPSAASITGIHRLSIDHRDDASSIFYWRMRRTSDTFFYRDDTGVWQAGAFDNPMTVRTTRTRDVSKPIDFGAATTFNFTLRQIAGAGGGAGRVNRLYHVQLEDGYAVTSRIVTDSSTVTRALATYKYAHTTAKRGILPTNGTWQGKWTPFFSSSDVSSGTITIWEIVFDANNLFRLQYNAATGNLEFVIRQTGTSTTATKSVTLTRGTEVDLAVRWTSTVGELGLTARSHSVFVNGVKGTDATRAGDPTEGTADLYMGGSSTVGANGKLRRWVWRPVCLRDEEIARGTP